ncbi:MAG: dTDP-4-dehydrorhamnose reductase [Candidatus Dadabacteria bacterium]|nr:MAG: dTDP-4-dehydrorhamnose reductase [Candidatus Dadabacteria bacterium]
MRVLLFGGSGQLGYEIRKRLQQINFEVFFPSANETDITDEGEVCSIVESVRPDVVINSAAYTAVDLAESEPEKAYKINCLGALNVARCAQKINASLYFISTDYVFDGNKNTPWKEDDKPSPLNVYGKTKLAGEEAVVRECEKYTILRTSSLHGAKGQNFVQTMIKLFKEKEEVGVVQDQIMSPTWAGWLAEVIVDLIRTYQPHFGIVHACEAGETSWFEFAKKIKRFLEEEGKIEVSCRVKPITTAEFPRPAKRPPYSVLNCDKLEAILNEKRPHWEQGLLSHLKEINFGKEL